MAGRRAAAKGKVRKDRVFTVRSDSFSKHVITVLNIHCTYTYTYIYISDTYSVYIEKIRRK